MITLVLAVAALYFFILWKMNRGNFVFSPSAVHIAYLALYVIIPALVLYASDSAHSFGGKDSYYISQRTIFSIVLAMIGSAVGTLIIGRGQEKQTVPAPDLQQRRFVLFTALAFALSLAFVLKNYALFQVIDSFKALGDPTHYATVQRLKMEVLFGSTYLLQGVNHIIPFLVLFFFAKYYCGASKRYLHLAIALIIFDVLFEIQCGNSWVGFSLPVMAVMLIHYFRPASGKQIVLVGLLLFTLVTGLLVVKFGRSSLDRDDQGTLLLLSMTGQRFASGAATLELLLETYPRERPYEHGLTYAYDALALIPSPIKRTFLAESWWGGFNGFMSYYIGFYGGTGQIPVMGEFYANFGMFGVVLGSVLYGMALQKLSNALRAHSITSASVVVFVVVLGYRLAEATVEGIGGRFIVSCLWIAIFLAYYA